ncbi:DUF5689 domain-containing protein [Flagellimonas nanhaiensis]|uniref:Lamin tail domain-containing protein n=1 Tax=Flagellimonas nanhaiensis TaxID=2292706 RepID=A0A371JQ28_9FLAO|nr:DUF5689 domain-containing protein [Allomuricauda nanhaiensis]RDY59612.1 lamin tail domain-containing protein [Allomuricauda nanhaiensis]
MKEKLVKTTTFFALLTALSCVDNREFDTLGQNCNPDLEANITFEEVEALVQDKVVQIQDDLVLEGYVISSDEAGNFFGILHIQNDLAKPTHGLQVEIDLRESHLLFPLGSKVMIKLKGLYLDKKEEDLKLGSVFTSFGNASVGRLPGLKAKEHIFLSCEGSEGAQPTLVTISEVGNIPANTLIKLEGLEFVEDELGQAFAVETEETARRLKDCEENEIVLLNSGYSDFQQETLPNGNGTVTAVLIKDGGESKLVIRGLNDLDFVNERCPEVITEFTSTQIFISELADPDNNSGARFVELFNAGQEPLDLNLWTLRRYTNDNTEVGSTIDLTGLIIGAESTLVISPNTSEFELVYGFPPDLGVSTNTPADSNGDDNLELVDPFGTVIDAFGILGEDGSGTNHEFEDGRAVRHQDITEGNPIYTFEEWMLYNDTGEAGTIKQPQNAPEDFTPGLRE